MGCSSLSPHSLVRTSHTTTAEAQLAQKEQFCPEGREPKILGNGITALVSVQLKANVIYYCGVRQESPGDEPCLENPPSENDVKV